MNARSSTTSRKWLAGLASLLAAAAALYATRPRTNQLVPYTTQPLNPQGDRISLLVPRDWIVGHEPNGNDIIVGPVDRYPSWIIRLGLARVEEHALLTVNWLSGRGRQTPGWPDGENYMSFRIKNTPVWMTVGLIPGKGLEKFCITYERTDKSAFDATHSAIFRSARIIRRMGQ